MVIEVKRLYSTFLLGLCMALSVLLLLAWLPQEVRTGEVTAAWDISPIFPSNNCTFTQGFWKNHPEVWPIEDISLGDVLYTKAEAIDILKTPPARGDATYILAHQLIAAKLNILNEADPGAVETTITDADDWLSTYPPGSNPPDPDHTVGVGLAETLDDYNNGLIGPGHCEDIELIDFKVKKDANDGAILVWETFLEIDITGFNLYRATTEDGPYTQINDALIAAKGDLVSGASYSYTNGALINGVTYYYELEYVNSQDVGTLYGPISFKLTHQIYLPLVFKEG